MTNESNITQVIKYCKYLKPVSDAEEAAQAAAILIVGIFGVFCNAFTILLATKYIVRRNLHFLIINMAVSDTFVIVTTLLTAAKLFLKLDLTKYLGECGWVPFDLLDNTSKFVSLFTLAIISIERYRITRRRVVQISQPYSVKQRLCLLCCTWCLSAVVNMNHLIVDRQCAKKPRYYRKIWVHFKLTLAIFTLLLLSILSFLTLRRLSCPQAIDSNLSQLQRNLRRQRIRSAVKMVLYSLLLYFCCYFPTYAFHLVKAIFYLFSTTVLPDDVCIDWRSFVFVIGALLPVVNSCFSPLVYLFCLPDFRQAAKTLLCRARIPDNFDSIATMNRGNSSQTSVSQTSVITTVL